MNRNVPPRASVRVALSPSGSVNLAVVPTLTRANVVFAGVTRAAAERVAGEIADQIIHGDDDWFFEFQRPGRQYARDMGRFVVGGARDGDRHAGACALRWAGNA